MDKTVHSARDTKIDGTDYAAGTSVYSMRNEATGKATANILGEQLM